MYQFTVESNEWLTPSTILLSLQRSPDEHKAIGYFPGQYAAIAYSHNGRPSFARCFSITSSPSELDKLQFSIRVQGRFTRRLSSIEPGSDIVVRGPYGGFVLDPIKHHEVIFIAGGIGIAPFMSMLRHMHATDYPHRVDLLYSVHDQTDIAFVDELRTLEREMHNLNIVYAVSTGETKSLAGQHVSRGRLDAATLQTAIDGRPNEKTIFICGPPPFMNSIVSLAVAHGMPSASIITEAFNQGNHLQTGKVLSWPRNMYALSAIGVALGSVAIMVADIVKNLPSTPLVDDTAARSQLHSKNGREQDLDTLIKGLSSNLENGRTDSPATTRAISEANAAASAAVVTSTAPPQTNNTSPKTSNPTTTSTASVSLSPAPAPTPAPAPKPVCITSPSGVTTCN